MFDSTLDRDFNKNFMISFGAHVAIALIAYLGGQAVMKVFNQGNVEIIHSAVRVDVVGMPKFTVQELKALQKEANLQAEPLEVKGSKEETKTDAEDVIKKDDLVVQEASKKKKTSFLNMISDYSNKKVSIKDKKQGSKQGENSDLKSLILEGNRLSKGSALVGDYSDESNSAFSAYVQTLPGIVRPLWKLPSYLKEQDLRCKIALYLSPMGAVLKTELIESSGHADFDARAEKAARDASYPKPSPEVAARLSNAGIILRFPL
jgi:outer membrane biosynthesis protein TonB